jgi:hypothetical protein
MNDWMSSGAFEQCCRFSGERFETKKQPEGLALERGIVLIQPIGENYKEFLKKNTSIC